MHVDSLHAIMAIAFLVVLAIVCQIIKWPRSAHARSEFSDIGGGNASLNASPSIQRSEYRKQFNRHRSPHRAKAHQNAGRPDRVDTREPRPVPEPAVQQHPVRKPVDRGAPRRNVSWEKPHIHSETSNPSLPQKATPEKQANVPFPGVTNVERSRLDGSDG